MIGADYWKLVEADPRDWSRDQKILFWWVVELLTRVGPQGVIAAPGQAPLNDDQITEVFKQILPREGGRKGERSYLDKIWTYEGQLVILPSADNHFVMLESGRIVIKDDPDAQSREKL